MGQQSTHDLTNNPLLDQLLGSQASEIRWIFHCLELAEEICAELGDPPGLFRRLRPSPILRGKPDRLVLHHMREIAGGWMR